MSVVIKHDTPLAFDQVKQQIAASGIKQIGQASIRELVRLVNTIEQETGERFIRMEMGVPGIDAPRIGLDAEIDALNRGVAAKYPPLDGVPVLKSEISRFCKAFMNIDVSPQGCLPTVGSGQGGIATFMVANRTRADHTGGTLFIDPGYPTQKKQLQVLGQAWGSFDVYKHRGEKLRDALEQHLSGGNYSSLLYSNPNNPSWICFNEDELKIIAEVADKYDVIVIEDLAYFGMDFRKDYSRPGEAPFQPTVARYTDNYVLLISSSKSFSYAGQRVGCLVISDALFKREYADLEASFGSSQYGYASVYGALYALSSGTSHSAQYGLAAMIKAANDGEFDFVKDVSIYGQRAYKMKRLFTDNGFNIVYDQDDGEPLADGFYFTVSYPGMDGAMLQEALLYYGISAIGLGISGSERSEGLRACVSQVQDEQLPVLQERLRRFHFQFGR